MGDEGAMNSQVGFAEFKDPEHFSETVPMFTGMPKPRVERLHRGRFSARLEIPKFASTNMMCAMVNNCDLVIEPVGYTSLTMPLRGAIETDRGTFHADVVPHSADVLVGSAPLRLKSEAARMMVIRRFPSSAKS